MRPLHLITAALVASTFQTAAAQFEEVIPDNATNNEGNWFNTFPFGPAPNITVPRYQQIYGSQDLGAILGYGVTAIGCRLDGGWPTTGGGWSSSSAASTSRRRSARRA